MDPYSYSDYIYTTDKFVLPLNPLQLLCAVMSKRLGRSAMSVHIKLLSRAMEL